MTILSCPICDFKTEDLDIAGAAVTLKIHGKTHPQATATQEVQVQRDTTKTEGVKRPTVSAGGTTQDWKYFETRWDDYKTATRITGNKILIQLLECCEEQLRKDLTQSLGSSPLEKTEAVILAAMKNLAIREENVMVARATLSTMRQERGESVRKFGAKAKGQADICKYVVKCPTCEADVSYAEPQLRDTIVTGIYDHDIQLELFGSNKQDMNLEEVYKFVEAKEAGKRSASYFHTQQQPTSASAISSFKKQKSRTRDNTNNSSNNNTGGNQQRQQRHNQQQQLPQQQQQQLQQLQQVHQQLQQNMQYSQRQPGINSGAQATPTQSTNTQQLCNNCGLPGHGEKTPSHVRQNCCPAYNYTCSTCGKQHHFESVCRHRRNRAAHIEDTDNQDTTEAGAFFTTLCSISSETQCELINNGIPLEHHIHDNLTETWHRSISKPQPFVKVSMSAHWEDYTLLGFDFHHNNRIVTASALADTGCQSSLAGINIIAKLGIRKEDLLPVTMKMHAANNNGINILGAAVLRFSGKSLSGRTITTRQIVYITDSTDKLFLSKDACIQLGMISKNFPLIGEISNDHGANATADSSTADPNAPAPNIMQNHTPELNCSCPKRTLPPSIPEKLPFSPADKNIREKLQQYLLEYYSFFYYYY